jgi:choline dehydrogenase
MPAFSHDRGFMAEPDERGRSVPLPWGRLMGGCSATNACFALSGWPQDYDQWAATGNPGWLFADLLRSSAPSSLTPISAATGTGPMGRSRSADPRPGAVAVAAGLHRCRCRRRSPAGRRPQRAGHGGYGPGPRNVRDGPRMSTALTHLAAARGRPNLAIRAGAAVDRVELHGTTARGVRLAGGQVIEADTIMMTAGSYASPAILMQSGIGPAAALRDLGIGVAADLPGGRGQPDRPPAGCRRPAHRARLCRPRFQVMLTLRSPWPTQAGHPTCTFSPPDRSTTPRARQAGYSAWAPGCWRSAPGLGAPALG